MPTDGRYRVLQEMNDAGVCFTWHELNGAHAFMRDEGSAGRYDAALAMQCYAMSVELFQRRLHDGCGTASCACSRPRPLPSQFGRARPVACGRGDLGESVLPEEGMRDAAWVFCAGMSLCRRTRVGPGGSQRTRASSLCMLGMSVSAHAPHRQPFGRLAARCEREAEQPEDSSALRLFEGRAAQAGGSSREQGLSRPKLSVAHNASTHSKAASPLFGFSYTRLKGGSLIICLAATHYQAATWRRVGGGGVRDLDDGGGRPG